ncbi:MAG: hypothetical protein GC201_16700, partial [Alphaproteobacteria bacterium]|nr:hypothetical protein [Alphaproteobacteria bacterium]
MRPPRPAGWRSAPNCSTSPTPSGSGGRPGMNAWKTYLPRLSTPGTIAFLGALVLISLTVVVVLYQQHGYRSQKLREVVAQSEVLGASVTAALVFDDAKAAQDYVSALGAYPGLEVAAVYDASHRLVASISRDNAGGAPATVRVHSPYFSGDRIYVTSPVLQGSTQVGEVYMRVRVDSPAQRVVRFAGIVLLVSMAILMLSALGMTQQALKRANLELQKEMAERARAEEALRQSQKMEALGQLAGGIAHDFNNLLAIIKSSLQLMQRRIGPAAQDVQRFMDAALDAVNRAASVTERVLVFSRRQTLSPQP